MNLLDKAIGIVSPRAVLQRARSRVALELTQGYLDRHAQRFRYDGATAGRRAYGWYAASTDANVELMGSLIWLRNRSRDLIRNNPYSARAVEELAGNVVGTGIVPKAKTGNTALDRIIDAEWPFFADACDTPQRLDFYGMQTLTVRTMAESGEAIVRFRPRLAESGLRVPLQLQMLEADFLDQARTMGLINGHVMEGVQFDELGRRVAYWLFSYHPGGVLMARRRTSSAWTRWRHCPPPRRCRITTGRRAPLFPRDGRLRFGRSWSRAARSTTSCTSRTMATPARFRLCTSPRRCPR
jgi:capsid protein